MLRLEKSDIESVILAGSLFSRSGRAKRRITRHWWRENVVLVRAQRDFFKDFPFFALKSTKFSGLQGLLRYPWAGS